MKKQKEKIKINLGCGIIPVKGFINVDKFYTEAQLKSKAGFNGYRKPIKDESGVYWCNCNIPVLVSPLGVFHWKL